MGPGSQQSAVIAGLKIRVFESVGDAADSLWSAGEVRAGKLVAVNAEKILKVRTDGLLNTILSEETTLYADGISIAWCLKRQGFDASKVAGCELWVALMERAARHGTPTLILGATERVNQLTLKKLRREFGASNIVGLNGYDYGERDFLACLDEFKPEIVTIALGSPKQEYLMQKLFESYPSALYMGVGGSYDVYTGTLRRAPDWMLRYNLEFLFRLFQQPSRIFRQLKLLEFFWLVFRRKL